MKSLLCLVMLVAFSWTSYAQPQSNENENKKSYMYCEIVGMTKFMSNKVNITLDFGQFNKFGSDQRLRDEEGKPIVFNSMVDAMNWMGADGWKFMQAYAVTMGSTNVYHWLLRLDLDTLTPEEKEAALAKFKTKADFKDK